MAQADRATGALLGLCIGDACGALLEIPLCQSISPDKVEWALSMPGGGAHRLGPGQITDDSEMALALSHALASTHPPSFPAEEVAKAYAHWLESRPFTVGKTSRAACLAASQALKKADGGSAAKAMIKTANKESSWSQANGALMRIAPLAIWGHSLDDSQLAMCAGMDAALTHPHENCQGCNAVFSIALARLVHVPGNADAAIAAAINYATVHAPPDVYNWLQEALDTARPIPSVTQAGSSEWVCWAFMLSFRHLKLQSSYESALQDVLSQGGATDTNAAVVGAMMGALHGAAAIPDSLKAPVLSRGPLSRGNPKFPRPPWLHTKLVPGLCQQLLHASYSACAMELNTPEKMTSR